MGKNTQQMNSEGMPFNPLTNRRVRVEFVPQNTGLAPNNPKHVLYGGKMQGVGTTLCVPLLRTTGGYKNVLTNDEKQFFEKFLGMEDNALSVYNKVNNYWDDYFVTIPKEGLILDLSDPEDYIRYKVLLCNSEVIAPSKQELLDRPKATYQFVIVDEGDEVNLENMKMDATMKSYKEFGKIESDVDTMRVLVELLDARPYAENSGSNFFRSRINQLIQADPKRFLSTITDPMLHTKVIIRRGTELGVLTKRGDGYYLRSDGTPLCENGEDPTLSVAAKFLNQPSHQDIKFVVESKVNENKSV